MNYRNIALSPEERQQVRDAIRLHPDYTGPYVSTLKKIELLQWLEKLDLSLQEILGGPPHLHQNISNGGVTDDLRSRTVKLPPLWAADFADDL